MGATGELCEVLAGLTSETIPDAAYHAARCLLLDGVAVALAGSLERASQIIAEHVRRLGGTKQATALNFGFRTSTVSAAYLNGAAMHVLDYEPMWNPPSHALSTTLPTALAIGERDGIGGKEILTALIKGIEAHGRLRAASRQYEPRELVFHPPGVAGPIGSAVAAGHLLRLNATQLRNAVGIAASRAGSVLANVGTMTKCTHCGNAAAAGLEAALLAEAGLTANPDVIEAPNGLGAAFFARDWEPGALTIAGAPLRVIEPGFAIKMFPSQYATHFVILAALEARSHLSSLDRIRTVRISGPIMPYVDRPRPTTGLDAKFSFQYAVASALLDGIVGIGTFSDESCRRESVVAMLNKVDFLQKPEIPAALDRMWVEVTVDLDDGEAVTAKCARPKGAWGTPIPEPEHLTKVRDCLRMVVDDGEAETLIDRLGRFDSLNGREVRGLMRALGRFS